MSQRELDDAIAQIVNEPVDEKVVRESAGRVFRKLFDSTFIASGQVDKIRSCADVQLLIPAYIAGTLTKPRAMLVEDHVLGCPACRRVLHPQANPVVTMQPRNGRRSHFAVYALAASLVVGIAIGVAGANRGILPGQHKLQATVESVQGNLYRVTSMGASLVEVGALVRNADELRTAKGSRAMLRLAGGAKLELAERSDVSMTSAWHGTDVNLQRGRMIVDANDTPQQTFYISTGDVVIPVRGTVLALDRGTKGSRVAVAKGTAQLERGRLRNTLYAGQQFATTHAVYNVPIASEFAWSENAAQYTTLLSELTALQKGLQSITMPGLRYSSTLAHYLPADTTVYAAIPNVGAALTQAKQMFDERLAGSEVLRNWWQQQSIAQNGKFDKMLSQVTAISSYLGEEIVFGLAANHDPVILSEIRQPGLADYIKANLPEISEGNGMFVRFDNNLLVVSSSKARTEQVETGGQFSGTPLFAKVKEVYDAGAGYFIAADLATITSGLNNAKYVVLERKDVAGTSETRAVLAFDGARQGVAAWLAAPGPAGSLDFVSPEAMFAASTVMKSPHAIIQEMLNYGANMDSGFQQQLSEFETAAGVSVLNDLAAPLGSDATFAIDGAGLPTSAWKLAIEVYDPERLKSTLATLVDRFNQQFNNSKMGKLQLTSHQASGLDVYLISSDKSAFLSVAYTFADGYFVAAGNEGNLLATIQNKRAGQTLSTSAAFKAKLPADGYTNFSAMLYHNLGNTLGPLTDQLKASTAISAQQRQMLAALNSSGPGMICLYGGTDRITAASSGSFLGFNLGTLAGIYQGEPVAPLIAANGALLRSSEMTKN